jgi:assimilatory nitrate reductase catalytic subunit
MNALPPHPQAVRTTCPYCGVGCGVLAVPDRNGGTTISGDPIHPANLGRLCSKGSALGETLSLDGRLLHPMLRQDHGSLAHVAWDTALDKVATGFRTIVDRDGPDAVAFYLSGQLLTEDYYVANKLMKGFLGSANVDTNSRLCMASAVAGHRRAFGADTVPGVYQDLDEADLIVLVGSNAAWCHPVLYQRMMAAKRVRGTKLVVIDPRRTPTADEADLFLPIAPGMDTALFCGLLAHLADTLALNELYIDRHTSGFVEALVRAREIASDVAATARVAGLQRADVARFFELFRKTERVVTCFSQGVNQSAQGTDKVNAIINVHLATGRIGRPGMGPFSLTGQPNAMGGREVGGLANQLAAHMDFSAADADRVRRFWQAPRLAAKPGLKAVDMFEAIERGEIKALWVMATNPAVSLPRAGAARAALQKLELFVCSENVVGNDTVASGAHILLPAAAWGEKDGTSPIRNDGCRGSARSCRCREKRSRIGGSSRRWRGASVLGAPSITAGPRTSSANTPRCPRSRITARAISTSAHSRRSPTTPMTASMRRCGRRPRARPRANRDSSAAAGFSRPTGVRASSRRRCRSRAPRPMRRFRSASIPAASATSGTP